MKNPLLKRPIDEQRAAIRARLDGYRLNRKPVCHIALADADYQLMLGDSLDNYTLDRELSVLELMQLVDAPAYEVVYGLKLVPLSEVRTHRESGDCGRQLAAEVA